MVELASPEEDQESKNHDEDHEHDRPPKEQIECASHNQAAPYFSKITSKRAGANCPPRGLTGEGVWKLIITHCIQAT